MSVDGRPPEHLPVDVVTRHPLVIELGSDPGDQRRAEGFARDLARWLYGRPARELSALARVVTIVAQRELRDTRHLCRERPLLSVEAAARATATLWPLLRRPEGPAPSAEEESPPEGDGGGGEGAGDDDEQGKSEPEEAGDDEGTADDEEGPSVLARLAEGEDDDPELDALIAALEERLGEGAEQADEAEVGESAAELLSGMTQSASEGALHTDQVAQHLERFLPGIGWSNAPGQLEHTLLGRLEKLSTLLGQLPELRQLADALGRLEDASRKEGKRDGGREEVVGVRFGGDVRTALPAELGLLGDPDLEDLFYSRMVEHRLVSLELAGAGDEGRAEGQKRGPIIACIDTSASMEGAPELAAKALVLAVCRSALPRGRVVHLLLFGGKGEKTEIRLRRGLGGLEGLLTFLEAAFHSGTDFDGPLVRALELLEEQQLDLADILVVTDGLCRAHPDVIRQVDRAKEQRGVRVYSVVLGNDDPRGVAPFSDTVLHVDPKAPSGTGPLLRTLSR
jgi:uncharacterized protein with von Willebrand factor type A (vWA) domain